MDLGKASSNDLFVLPSFTKIMTDEAVSSWRFDIHKCILKNCEKLVQLICTKLQVTEFLDGFTPLSTAEPEPSAAELFGLETERTQIGSDRQYCCSVVGTGTAFRPICKQPVTDFNFSAVLVPDKNNNKNIL